MVSVYPVRGRTEWILAQRPLRRGVPDPEKPQGISLEQERMASGTVEPSGVVLLTNRECPWRCLMCDLWKDTTTESVAPGAIPRQLEIALRTWSEAGVAPYQVKLYNSGSFFDPAAIPLEDYAGVARQLASAKNVVVESHPRLVGERTLRLRDLLAGSLEVAMGLETAQPEILERLNKGFDLAQFARAADFLRAGEMALRVFLLVNPPFVDEREGLDWVVKSARYAFACGASVVSLIPTRTGNGAMERLLASGEFVPPTLATIEEAVHRVLGLKAGRVFSDLWGLEAFSTCDACFAARRDRLHGINLSQTEPPRVSCRACGAA